MSSNSSGSGVGCLGVIQIVLIILKLVGTIDWIWPVVLIPTFIGVGMIALAILFMIAFKAFR